MSTRKARTAHAADAIETVDAGAVQLACLQCGSGPLVLCLHGFPDTAWSMTGPMQRLADAGFHAVAPFMRGYAPSSLAADDDYSIAALARDVAALADRYGKGKAWVVGHDWGAAAAYGAAAMFPERIEGIVTAAVPPLRRFLFKPTPGQLRASHYMFKFQLPGWAERRIPANDYDWLVRLAQSWSPEWAMPDAYVGQVKRALGTPANLRAALRYYRAIPRLLLDGGARRAVLQPTPVPGRVISGSEDHCILPEMFDELDPYFAAEHDSVEIAGAGHFMPLEAPQAFADAVLGFIQDGRRRA